MRAWACRRSTRTAARRNACTSTTIATMAAFLQTTRRSGALSPYSHRKTKVLYRGGRRARARPRTSGEGSSCSSASRPAVNRDVAGSSSARSPSREPSASVLTPNTECTLLHTRDKSLSQVGSERTLRARKSSALTTTLTARQPSFRGVTVRCVSFLFRPVELLLVVAVGGRTVSALVVRACHSEVSQTKRTMRNSRHTMAPQGEGLCIEYDWDFIDGHTVEIL